MSKKNKNSIEKPPSNTITGIIHITRSGNGFLEPDDSTQDDIYIGETFLGSALDGDKVRITLDKPSGRGVRQFGHITEIIERNTSRIVAIVNSEKNARPEDPKNPFDYQILNYPEKLQPNTKVLFEIVQFADDEHEPTGKVIEILGPAGAPSTEVAAILAGFQAPGAFSEEVKKLARDLAKEPLKFDDRDDLTDLLCCTIDPDTARDYDDALSIEELKNGNFCVGIHIADVSHFVTPNNEIDKTARERSTSIYLPERVIPMLPEELSNDVCSLRPREKRLAKTVFVEFTRDGEMIKYHIHRSVICSAHRLTYKQVKQLLTDDDAAKNFGDAPMISALHSLNNLAQTLRARRIENGSLELNMQETIILLDEQGNATGLATVENDFSHQLVEEFMLSANICVALWAKDNGLPVLHRVHESPNDEALESLADFLNASGYIFRPPFKRDKLQKVLAQVHNKPEEHAINLAILKSFSRAIYAPSADIGHFALNFPSYLHFTSPIRRYPDLQLHQMLDLAFTQFKAPKLGKKLRKKILPKNFNLQTLGEHCSAMERRSMKIEESVKDFRRLEILNKSSERIFKAVVTGIRKFGIFVEVEDFLVEGMIPRWQVEKMGFSTREVRPNTQSEGVNGFSLGQEVKVKITNIDLSARTCEMELIP